MNISDDDLILLFYGEHPDPELAAHVAKDPALRERLNRLGEELSQLDQAFQAPPRDRHYGSRVWQQLSPQLAEVKPQRRSFWRIDFRMPALASVIIAVVLVAFLAGRESVEPSPTIVVLESPAGATQGQRILAHYTARHLTEVDILLSQFEAGAEEHVDREWAQEVLTANRLYRRSAADRGNQRLATALAELEPVLIELANADAIPGSRVEARLIEEMKQMLFRVRIIQAELKRETQQPKETTYEV